MRRIAILCAALVAMAAGAARGASRYVAASGSSNTTATWSATACDGATGAAVPTSVDDVILCPGKLLTIPCAATLTAAQVDDYDGDWSSGGGLTTATGCTQGQVPKITLSGTANTSGVQLDAMTSDARFELKGRAIFTDLPIGAPLDLTSNCGGSDQTVNGITWEAAKNECATYTWASQPWLGQVGTLNGAAGVKAGDILWLNTGQWRNNFLVVISATATTITVGYGDPNDDKGTVGGFVPSLQAARDTTVSAWDSTNPLRKIATVTAGTLPSTGALQGSCLVMQTGNYYRIAGSIDGGAGADTLVMDPWMQIQPEDAAGGAAWIAPCIKPGDRFDAFEPVLVQPGTPGTHYVSLGFFSGLCPVLEKVYLPFPAATLAPTGGVLEDMRGGVVNFYGQSSCAVNGPVAIQSLRMVSNSWPYVVRIKATSGLTLDRFSIQGFYASTGAGPVTGHVAHGFNFQDSSELLIKRANVSFINNEAMWLQDETSEADSPFEGSTVTIDSMTIHDIFRTSDETDGEGGFQFNTTGFSVGTFGYKVRDSIGWNVGLAQAAFITTAAAAGGSGEFFDNVLAYSHRARESASAVRTDISCGGLVAGDNDADFWIANNAFLTSVTYSTDYANGTANCKNVYYSYFGEHYNAIRLGQGPTTGGSNIYSLLIDSGGNSVTSPSSAASAVEYQRNTGQTGDQILRDLTVRNHCATGSGVNWGVVQLAQTAAAVTFKPIWTHLTLGAYCPSASAMTCGTGSCAGIRMSGSDTNLAAGSTISDVLIAPGDQTASADTWEVYATLFGSAATGNLAIDRILCSECSASSTCQSACLRNAATAGYTLGSVRVDYNAGLGKLGVYSDTDLRLRSESPALAMARPDNVIGARYSGIVRYSQAMRDFDIPQEWMIYRATPEQVPDRTVLPNALKFLIPAHGGGGALPRPRAY